MRRRRHAVSYAALAKRRFYQPIWTGLFRLPRGDRNHFVEFPQGSPLIYKICAYRVDFTTPANSTFAVQASVGAASFTSLYSTTRDCQAVTGWAVIFRWRRNELMTDMS